MAKLVLVTGISGFIAKHCAVELLKNGYHVRGTLRSLSKADAVRETLAQHCDVTHLSFVAADLGADAGWHEATADVWGVAHLASPFPLAQPKDESELIRPAVDGTLRVLRAAVENNVQRFVQTSSIAAIMEGHSRDRVAPFTEADWSDVNGPGINAYAKSKTLAERAARDHMLSSKSSMHYASVNPGFVLGPLLDKELGSSAEVIRMFMRGKYPGSPRLSFPTVDVRDIAVMHRLALETKEPSGGRYMGCAESSWFIDMMRPIKAQLGERARKVPSRQVPDFVLRIIALFDPAARSVVSSLGHESKFDNSQTRKALNISFRPIAESAPAMAKSLDDLGLV
jgi:dihydroflavonol-4-reductase